MYKAEGMIGSRKHMFGGWETRGKVLGAGRSWWREFGA